MNIKEKTVHTSSGEALKYDNLVIATGGDVIYFLVIF